MAISRRTRFSSLIIIIIVGVLIALSLSIFRNYLGTRLSGVPLDQTVIGGALKSDGLTIGTHALEFRGRTRDSQQLAHQVSFMLQAPDAVIVTPPTVVPAGTVVAKRIIFRIDNTFLQELSESEVRRRLADYVRDMNSMLEQNTILQFSYNSATDVEFVAPSSIPSVFQCLSSLDRNFKFMIYVRKSNIGESVGGGAACDDGNNNSVVVGGMRWHDIYSRTQVTTETGIPPTEEVRETWEDYYSMQIYTLLHEMGHLLGVAPGEYYQHASMVDNSGTAPDLDTGLHFVDPLGPFHKDHQLIFADPMFSNYPLIRQGRATTAANQFRFSPLSATIINKVLRGEVSTSCYQAGVGFTSTTGCDISVPDFSIEHPSVTVEVQNAMTGARLSNCPVQMYALRAPGQSDATPMASGTTDSNGQYVVQWGITEGNPADVHTSYNGARLFKVQCSGYEPSGAWLTGLDLQAGRLMPNGGVEGDFRYPGKLIIPLQPL